jgi:hypothetical protein
LLRYNPHHLLKPYLSLAEALRAVDVQAYVNALHRSHPLEQARHLLATIDSPEPLKGADEREVFAHEAHDREEEASIFRLRDTPSEKNDPRWHVSASSALRRDTTVSPTLGSVAIEVSQPFAIKSPEPDIYRIRHEDLPEHTDPSDAGESEFAGGQWVVFGLYFAVLISGLTLTGVVLLRPFWKFLW